MTYHRSSTVSTNMKSAIATALNNEIAPTHITVATEQSSPDSNTDVIYEEGPYYGYQTTCGTTALYWYGTANVPSGAAVVLAWTKCQSLSGSKCQSFAIFISQPWEAGTTNANRLHNACHETGHAVGLIHTAPAYTSCLNTVSSASLSQHDKDHLNANY